MRPSANAKRAEAPSVRPSPTSTSSVTTYSGMKSRKLDALSRATSGLTAATIRSTETSSIAVRRAPTSASRPGAATTWSPLGNA